MKLTSYLTISFLGGQALASLNCTVLQPTITKRYCEWDGCQAYETAAADAILHAGCRADCDTDDDPWLKLYDGSYVRASNETLTDCRYFCLPFPVTGLPHCYEEAGQSRPSTCAESSISGEAHSTTGLKPLGTEPPPFSDVASRCSITAVQVTQTPAPLVV